jgi:4-alpha-glucanotransferase
MSDAEVRGLARRAGISVEWTDYAGQPQSVSIGVLRSILAALGLPCEHADERAASGRALDQTAHDLPPLLAATAGRSIAIPAIAGLPLNARLLQEDGGSQDLVLRRRRNGTVAVPPVARAGYHKLEIGDRRLILAVAPSRCHTISDVAHGGRLWGLAVQVYGLRRPGDCGIGNTAAIADLARSATRQHADVLALSPTHAMFAANPSQFSPYSPSSRLFYNVLHADPHTVFSEAEIAKARGDCGAEIAQFEAASIIDWPRAGLTKLAVFRRLFDDLASRDASASDARLAEFAKFRAESGEPLQQHACFEALHAARSATDPTQSSWLRWPAVLRDPHSSVVAEFARTHHHEIGFHCFLQWLASCSLSRAQRSALDAGMRVGLLADLAVGMSGSGSHAWARQTDILVGLGIGAPPDLFNAGGQNWGLTTFSPRALMNGGFAPFIDTLRATMRYAGGLRIDHIMGLMRLWVIPDGAKPTEGAYLAYPLEDLLRLLALESHRHRAIVIGEDLGTVPEGFRQRLARNGILGMRVLWFERSGERFAAPSAWSKAAAAMTSTHDLPTVAGWWKGIDIPLRDRSGQIADFAEEQATRGKDRAALWRAFCSAKAANGPPPDAAGAARVVDAALRFAAHTPSALTLLPLEDALAREEQPNLPGTIDEYPNWRIRYEGDAAQLLDADDVRARLQPLEQRAER